MERADHHREPQGYPCPIEIAVQVERSRAWRLLCPPARLHAAQEHRGIEQLARVGHDRLGSDRPGRQSCLQPFAPGRNVAEIDEGIVMAGLAPKVLQTVARRPLELHFWKAAIRPSGTAFVA